MEAIDRDQREAADQGAVPGVVALAMHDGRVVLSGRLRSPRAAGWSRDEHGYRLPHRLHDQGGNRCGGHADGRTGKTVARGTGGEIVPELKEPVVLEGFDESGTPRTRPARRQITLRHLLTHTAGFGYDIWNSDIARYCRVTGLPAPRTGLLAGLRAPLTSDPGERWQYSISIDWAGRMVEAVSGMDLETYFQTRIFAPLGMEDTSYEVRPHMLPRLATAYARKDGSLQPLMIEPNPVREFFPGGGGLHSTAGDYMRLPAHDGEWRRTGWRPRVAAADRGRHGAQPHRRSAGGEDGFIQSSIVQRRRTLPRHEQEMGAELPDQHGGRALRPERRQPRLGRPL